MYRAHNQTYAMEMNFFGYQVLFSALLVLVLFFFHEKCKKSSRTLPPGPRQWPIIGSINVLLRKNKPVSQWIHGLMKEMNTDIICVRFFRTNVIVVSCDDIAREFLKKQDAVFASRPLSRPAEIITNGYLSTIFSPFGEQWNKMKTMLSSEILCSSRQAWLLQKRNEEADNVVYYVYKQRGDNLTSGLVNVRFVAQFYCANVGRRTIFNKRFFGNGTKDGGPGVEELEHVNAILTLEKHTFAFCVSDYVGFLRGRVDLDGHEKIIRKAFETIKKYHDRLIEERAQQWERKNRTACEDLLDVMLSLKNIDGTKLLLTIDEIKAQIIDMVIAGLDNPSNAVEWALAEMINQPRILEKAKNELDSIVGKDRLVQESDLSKLNYIKSCIKEAFRLHPLVPFNLTHVSLSDTTVAGYFIPKGSHVLLSRPGLGRNPKLWVDPLTFNPERHLSAGDTSEVTLTDHELRLLSFSTGRRRCPAASLGSTMTTMLLARLLQGFDWSSRPTESRVDLAEAHDGLAMAKPLVALATPRLNHNLYPKVN